MPGSAGGGPTLPPGTCWSSTLAARYGRSSRRLHDSRGEGDAHADEDKAADELTPLARPGAKPAAQFQADQRHSDADSTDHYGGHGQADVVGAQGEADGEVVDAQRYPGDQQPPGRRPGLSARLARSALTDCLHQRVK